MAYPYLKELLDDLTFIAKNIGTDWRDVFIKLGFKDVDCDHFEYDNKNNLLEIKLEAFHEWKKKPCPKIRDRNVKEVREFIVWALGQSERQDIIDATTNEPTDIDAMIEVLSIQLTGESRTVMLRALGIAHEDIKAAKGKKLADETKGILQKWLEEQLTRYWKYQDLLSVLNESGYSNVVNDIIKKFEELHSCKTFDKNIKSQDTNLAENKSIRVSDCKMQNTINTKSTETSSLPNPEVNDTILYKRLRDSPNNEDEVVPSKRLKVSDKQDQEQASLEKSGIQLRKYQEELAEIALNGQNTIMCVDTNAGKTMVAFHVIEDIFRKNSDAKIVFMAPTKPLVDQQYRKAIEYVTCFDDTEKIVSFSLDDESTAETIRNVFENGCLFFMTPQTLVNRLEQNPKYCIPITYFSLLVFDECHHAHGNTPYKAIMSCYRRVKHQGKRDKLPQILGLTASPGTNKANDEASATKHLLTLMTIMDVIRLSAVQKNIEDLKEYINQPESCTIKAQQRHNDPVKDTLIAAIQNVEKMFHCEKVNLFLKTKPSETRALSRCLNSPPSEKWEQKYSQWISETRQKVEQVLKQDEYIPRLLLASLRHLEIYAGCLEMNSLLDIEAVEGKITDEFNRESFYSMTANTSEEGCLVKVLENARNSIINLDKESLEKNPDVQTIIKMINDGYQDQKDDFRCIIYVKTRSSAMALSERLRSLEFLNCQYFTGSQVGIEYGGISQEKQKDILQNFQNGVHKCLVATSVASEGIDIPLLNLVIRYRFTGNEISSRQIKGRVRSFGGKEVNIASSKEDRRENLNVDRIVLMRKAVDVVLKDENDDKIEEHIKRAEKELYKLEESQRYKALNNDRVKVTANFEVTCRKCPQMIVAGHNLRILKGQHHLVYDPSIYQRSTREQIEKPILLDDSRLTHRVFGKCGHEWGHIFVYQDCEFVCLAQKSIKIFNVDRSTIINIRKWTEIPYNIQPLTDNEVVEFRL